MAKERDDSSGRYLLGVGLVMVVLLAAACGGGDAQADASASTMFDTTTTAPPASETTPTTPSSSSSSPVEPSSSSTGPEDETRETLVDAAVTFFDAYTTCAGAPGACDFDADVAPTLAQPLLSDARVEIDNLRTADQYAAGLSDLTYYVGEYRRLGAEPDRWGIELCIETGERRTMQKQADGDDTEVSALGGDGPLIQRFSLVQEDDKYLVDSTRQREDVPEETDCSSYENVS